MDTTTASETVSMGPYKPWPNGVGKYGIQDAYGIWVTFSVCNLETAKALCDAFNEKEKKEKGTEHD